MVMNGPNVYRRRFLVGAMGGLLSVEGGIEPAGNPGSGDGSDSTEQHLGTQTTSDEGEFTRGQDLVYSYYTDEKTGYPLGFWLYEEDTTKIVLAESLIEDAEEKAEVPAETHLFDS